MELPRTLVISSSFFSEKSNNGKTLSSFFFGYPVEKLSQLSFSVSTTNPSVCKRYFAITIIDVLRGKSGKEYTASSEDNVSSKSKRNNLLKDIFHHFSEKRLPITTFLKNKIWLFCNHNGIYKYVEAVKPEVVFFQGFSLSYGYRIALDICNKYKLPMILELTDDYTAHLYPHSLFDYINHKEYERYFEKAIRYSKSVIVISPKMRKEYEKRYQKQMIEMMNSVSLNINTNNIRDNHLFVYAGNIRLNRWKVLIEFAKAIHMIDPLNTLFICTPDEVQKKVLNAFGECKNIIYGGSLNPIELREKFSRCGYVVHVEAFDKTNKEITRYSLSTKIPEYMASGALMIAIGPDDIASMEYISEKNVGICINSLTCDEIYDKLNAVLNNNDLLNEVKACALEICYRNHSKDINSNIIKQLLADSCAN